MFVVSAVDIGVGPSVAAVTTQVMGQLLLELARFLIGENIFRSDGAGTLKRSTGGIVPNSLQVRIAPWSMQHRRFFRGPGCLGGGFQSLARNWRCHGDRGRQETR